MEPDYITEPARRIASNRSFTRPAGQATRWRSGHARSRITDIRVTVSENKALKGEGSLT